MSTIQRSIKRGNVRSFDQSYRMGFKSAWASEVDADFDLLFDAWNLGVPGGIAIQDGTITSAKLADGSVTNSKLAPNSVGSGNIMDGAVTTSDLQDHSVTTIKLAGAAVTSTELADNAVTTIKILDLAVSTSKLADLAVTTAKLADLGVTTGKVADLAITDAKIASLAWSKLTGVPTALPPSGAAGGSLQGTYPNPTLKANSVGATEILDGAVSLVELAPNVAQRLTPTYSIPQASQVLTVAADGQSMVWQAAPPATLAPGQVTTPYIADAPNGVTDAKITSVSWSKVSGAPTSLPPSGAAGGDLAGTYPNPTLRPGVTAVPGGAAGGDLSGSYPNPTIGIGKVTTAAIAAGAVGVAQIADGAVSNVKLAANAVSAAKIAPLAVTDAAINDVAYSKITGVPAAFPPSGAAGGSLAGTYPNPTLAPTGVAAGTYGSSTAIPRVGLSTEGRVTSISEVAVSIPPGTSVGATPPASPAQGQMWWRSDPDGNLYIWYNDGTSSQWVPAMSSVAGPWSVSGANLTPTDSTKKVYIPGDGGAVYGTLVQGAATVKSRLQVANTVPQATWSVNRDWNNSNAQDDATKTSWGLQLTSDFDQFRVQRQAAGSASAVNLLWVDGPSTNTTLAGSCVVNGNTVQISPSAAVAGVVSIFGYGTIGGLVRGYQAGGTPTAQTPSANGSLLCMYSGYGCFQAGNNYSEQATIRAIAAENWTSAARGTQWYFHTTPSGSTSMGSYMLLDGGANLTIIGATATKASGTTWANPSDRRIKDDIADYTTGLAAILALHPRTFLYNGKGGSKAGVRGYGYIADEAGSVIPEMLGAARAKLNADDEEDTDIQSLDTSNITLALVNAMKEVDARLRALEAR